MRGDTRAGGVMKACKGLKRALEEYLEGGGTFRGTKTNRVCRFYNVYDYAWQSFALYNSMFVCPGTNDGNIHEFRELHRRNQYFHYPIEDHLPIQTPPLILVGMNPGPWGMAQTGVPFGEVKHVREFLGIHANSVCRSTDNSDEFVPLAVSCPQNMHPKRKIDGFSCERSEVSGRRLWGFLKNRFESPLTMSRNVYVYNYCPLVFMGGQSGIANVVPEKLSAQEREFLYRVCNEALKEILLVLKPKVVVGVGLFAANRLKEVVDDISSPLELAILQHPSPASPSSKVWDSATTFNELLSKHSPVSDLDQHVSHS